MTNDNDDDSMGMENVRSAIYFNYIYSYIGFRKKLLLFRWAMDQPMRIMKYVCSAIIKVNKIVFNFRALIVHGMVIHLKCSEHHSTQN